MIIQDQYKEYINTERPGESYATCGGIPLKYRFRIRFTNKKADGTLRTFLVGYNNQDELESKRDLIEYVCNY